MECYRGEKLSEPNQRNVTNGLNKWSVLLRTKVLKFKIKVNKIGSKIHILNKIKVHKTGHV